MGSVAVLVMVVPLAVSATLLSSGKSRFAPLAERAQMPANAAVAGDEEAIVVLAVTEVPVAVALSPLADRVVAAAVAGDTSAVISAPAKPTAANVRNEFFLCRSDMSKTFLG